MKPLPHKLRGSGRRAAAERARISAGRRQRARERGEEASRQAGLYCERFRSRLSELQPSEVTSTAVSSAPVIAATQGQRHWLPLAAAAVLAVAFVFAFDRSLWPRWAAVALAPLSSNQVSDQRALPSIADAPVAEIRTDLPPNSVAGAGLGLLQEAVDSQQEWPEQSAIALHSKPVPPGRVHSSSNAWSAGAAGTVQAAEAVAALDFDPAKPRRSSETGICELPQEPAPGPDLKAASAADFGRALAHAAQSQTADFVVYTDKYKRIAYPMGDVPKLFGVCTDLVIRAYRTLGIDLQALIHDARLGSADTSIAHRRTFTLRRFFASRGASRRISEFPEDYLPGDIVTYDRPQNRRSRDHIAIVADVIAPSGRPMVVHNRGWGPQIEDALFVDKITGHYRYAGPREPGVVEGPPTKVPGNIKPQRKSRTGKLELPSIRR